MTKHVPVAAFKDRVSEYVAEAEAGGEIIITRHGKAAAKLVPYDTERKEKQRKAVEGLVSFGNWYKDKYGPTSAEELRALIEESRP